MAKPTKTDWKKRVVLAAREYGISAVLFRHMVGEKLGVNVTDMECLGLVFYKGLATPSELARYTGLTSGATTALLDRLEKGGLIERRPNPEDRRGTIIALTSSGANRVAPWFTAVRQAQDELVAQYSESELETICSFLESYARIWEESRRKLQQKR